MVISAASREKIAAEIAKYPVPRGALLPALHIVHAEHGYVSPECAQELASLFEIRPFEVLEVVSFYNMFYATPQPRHQVRVCTNLPCSLKGGRELLHRLEAHLGVKGGERDGRRAHPHRPRRMSWRLRLRADDARRSAIPRRSRRRARQAHPRRARLRLQHVLKAPYVTGYLTEHFADDAFGTLEGYVKRGGYQAARKALGEMTPGNGH